MIYSILELVKEKKMANTEMNQVLNFLGKLDAKLDLVASKVERLETRFDQFETRFDQLETRFDQLETRFDQFEKKTDERFDRLEKRMDQLEKRMDQLEIKTTQIESMTIQLINMVAENNVRISRLEEKCEKLQNHLYASDLKMAHLTFDLRIGSARQSYDDQVYQYIKEKFAQTDEMMSHFKKHISA
jgi:chromosome segregation ATPase